MAESHREEIAKLEALYAANPGGRVFVHLAEAYRKAGEHERARRILDEGLARHADSASGFVVLGRVLADMQIANEAEAAFRRVLSLDSGNLVALRWLGDIARQDGRTDEAVAHYRELLQRNPSNEEVRDLVEIVEREAGGDRHSEAATEPEWHDPAPMEQVPELPAEALTPLSAAPGQTGDEAAADVEFGLVEIEVAEATAPGSEAAEPALAGAEPVGGAGWPPVEPGAGRAPVEPGTESGAPVAAEELSVVESFGAEPDEAAEELSGLIRTDDAATLDINLLDPSYVPEEQADDFADDDFITDLLNAPVPAQAASDPGGFVDLEEGTGGFTLQDTPTDPGMTVDAASAETPFEDQHVVENDPPPLKPHGDDLGEAALSAGAGENAYPTVPSGERAEGASVRDELDAAAAAFADDDEEDPAEAAAVVELDPGVGSLEPGPVTETMAELYRAQGFHDRAAEVYRALLRHRPFDLRLSARLSEAETDAAAALRPMPQPDVPEDEAAGDVWLRGVGSSWDAGQQESHASATPYVWTEEADETPAGEPIGAYLRQLVTWKKPQFWAAPTPPPAAPPAAPAPSPEEEPWTLPSETGWGVTDRAEPVDPWGQQLPGSDAWSMTPDAGSADRSEEPTAAAAADSAASGSGRPLEGSANADPADPWLQTGPPPAEESAPPAGDPALAQHSAAEAAAPAMETSAPASTAQPLEEDEDEDLEMFRSWLQSLKK